MAWIFGLLFLGALLIAAWCFLAAIHLAQVANRAEGEAAALRLAIVEALTRAADEQIAKETALRLLDEMNVQRTAELRSIRGELEGLEAEYRRVLQLYRSALGGDAPRPPRLVH